MRRILDGTQERQRRDVRQVLHDLGASLAEFGAPPDDQMTLARSLRRLDDLFLLVVVGEFNSGKSAFINALLGTKVLEEGVTPTTARIHLITADEAEDSEDVQVVKAPVDLLRDIHIVDTPGTNAIIREHERLTAEFVPRCDLVLFVTSAERPFTETERAFLDSIRKWGKKIVIVLNKLDILDRPEERDQVLAFVSEASTELLGVRPEIFPVSARLAIWAKQSSPTSLADTGFDALERYITETLDERSRFRLKLASPLGVGLALATRYASMARERLDLVQDDLAMLADLERRRSASEEETTRGFELRMTAVEKVLVEMEARGHLYFEEMLRVARVMDLLNRARVQRDFEDKVVADAPRLIERRVGELVEWLTDQEFRHWQAVTSHLIQRRFARGTDAAGASDIGTFHADRARWLETVGQEAQRVVDSYDRRREAETIANQARAAVAAAVAAGGAALGLGTLVSVAATTAAADVTGLVMAGVLATVGFLIIPARRRRAKADLQQKLTALRNRLGSALRTEFQHARQEGRARLDATIAPYDRFVRAEQARWASAEHRFSRLKDGMTTLLKEIEAGAPVDR